MKRKIALALAAVMSVTSFAGFSVSANSALITRTITNWDKNQYVVGNGVTTGNDKTLAGTAIANDGVGTNYEVDFSTRGANAGARFSLTLDNSKFAYAYGATSTKASGVTTTPVTASVPNATDTDAGTLAGLRKDSVFNKLITTPMTEAELLIAGKTLTGFNGGYDEKFIFNGTKDDDGFWYDSTITYSPKATVDVNSTNVGTRTVTVKDVYDALDAGIDMSKLGNYFGDTAADKKSAYNSTSAGYISVSSNSGTTFVEVAATTTAIDALLDAESPTISLNSVLYSYDSSTPSNSTASTITCYTAKITTTGSASDAIYELVVPKNDNKTMYVTFPYGTTQGDIVSIPLSMKLGDTTSVTTLTVDALSSNIGGLGSTFRINAIITGTTLSVDKKTGKDTIALGDITVKESAAGVFQAGKYFELVVTDYYRITAGTFKGSVLGTGIDFANDGKIYTSVNAAIEGVTAGNKDVDGNLTSKITDSWTKASTAAAVACYTSSAKDIIRIYFNPNYASSGMAASVTLTGGVLQAEMDHEPITGDIVTITVKHRDSMTRVTNDASAEIAEFTELGIGYSAATAKDLYSGAIDREAAKVTIKENLLNAWSATRRTELSLVDKDGNLLEDVKFTSIARDDSSNITSPGTVTNTGKTNGLNSGDYYFNEAGNVVTFTNLTITANKLASLVLVPKLSAAPGFEGEVYLKISGNAVSGENLGNNGIVHIATFTQKAKITANATTIPANTTSYTVGDIVLTENGSGVLASGNVINIGFVDVNGNTTTDVRFRNVNSTNITTDGVRASVANNADGTLTITIDRASSTAGSITLSNLGVTVKSGLTSGVYNLVINGNAIANNTDVIRNGNLATTLTTAEKRTNTDYRRDAFDTAGFTVENYALIGTSGEKAALDMTVVYTSGSAVVVANGESVDMGLAPVNVNGSLFVPVRYTLAPYGIDPEKNVVWDAVTSTAFITVGDTRVEFVSGSSVYRVYVNGILTNIVEMVDANGTAVKSQIIDGRMFVPVRQFANAFGLDTNWDATSGEATFTLAK